MTTPLRRIVTGLDPQGRSTIIIDDAAPMSIWTSDRSPADNEGTQDAGGKSLDFDIPVGGSRLVWTDFPPDGTTGPLGVHATDTLDYAVILSGEVTLITEVGETLVRAGDVVVDRGVLHGWRNDGPEPCRAVVVLLPADPVGKGATIGRRGA